MSKIMSFCSYVNKKSYVLVSKTPLCAFVSIKTSKYLPIWKNRRNFAKIFSI